MKDEVKELLDKLEKTDGAPLIWFNKKLYEYPKEIKRLKEKVKEWQDNNKLNYIIKDAIEYIKNNAMYSEEWNKCCDDLYTKDCDKVLKILNGEMNESISNSK